MATEAERKKKEMERRLMQQAAQLSKLENTPQKTLNAIRNANATNVNQAQRLPSQPVKEAPARLEELEQGTPSAMPKQNVGMEQVQAPTSKKNAKPMDKKKEEAGDGSGLSQIFQGALGAAIPALIGSVFEGERGAIAGYQTAEQARQQMHNREIQAQDADTRQQQVEDLADYREKSLQQQRDLAIANIASQRQNQSEAAQVERGQELSKLEDFEQTALEKLNNIKQIRQQFEDYSSGSLAGTGPFATAFGYKANFDDELQGLNRKFRELQLDTMVEKFAGMSKAIDSDSERAAFLAAQADITQDDSVNRDALAGMERALESALAKARLKKYQAMFGNISRSQLVDLARQEKARRSGSK